MVPIFLYSDIMDFLLRLLYVNDHGQVPVIVDSWEWYM